MSPRALLLAPALLLLAPPAVADVLVVDAAGGGDFTSLVAAVAAAADGDTLLVRAGDYRQPGTITALTGMSLAIVADGSGPVLLGPLQASLNGPGQRLLLRGLTVEAGAWDPTTIALSVAGGDVLVEDCTLLGRDGHPALPNTFGGNALVVSSGRLVVVGGLVEGGRGSDSSAATFLGAQPGGYGIDLAGQPSVALHGVTVRGGQAGSHLPDPFATGPGSTGGLGLRASFGGALLVSGCTVQGGDGGDGDEVPGNFGPFTYAGGDAINLFGPTTLALRDSVLVPGAPGVDGAGQPGTPGDALEVGPVNTVLQHAATHRGLAFGAPAPEGGTLALDYSGEPGDLVGLFLSAGLAPPLAVKQGWFQLGAPLAGPLPLGVAGPAGSLSLAAPVPDLGLGPEDALQVYSQALVKPAAGPVVVSGPSATVLVDAGL